MEEILYASSGWGDALLVLLTISLSASLPFAECHHVISATWFTIVETASCPSSSALCIWVDSSVSILAVVPRSFWAVSFLGLPRPPCITLLQNASRYDRGCRCLGNWSPSFLFFGSWSHDRVLGWFWDLQLCRCPSLCTGHGCPSRVGPWKESVQLVRCAIVVEGIDIF